MHLKLPPRDSPHSWLGNPILSKIMDSPRTGLAPEIHCRDIFGKLNTHLLGFTMQKVSGDRRGNVSQPSSSKRVSSFVNLTSLSNQQKKHGRRRLFKPGSSTSAFARQPSVEDSLGEIHARLLHAGSKCDGLRPFVRRNHCGVCYDEKPLAYALKTDHAMHCN
ncbi:hypothetical protein BC827DRAFT_461173 [Russula dissimulans]|nr:hypothetical protein BC827DRAFT_461173 [Russula dissimulans]